MSGRRRGLAAAGFVLAAAAGGLAAPGAVSPATAADTCDGVWVVVKSSGVSGTRCASSYTTGKVALRSAGFTTRDQSPGFLCQISDFPTTCTITNDQHWAYWQATRNADGSFGPWRYSQLGYTSTRPKKGDAEGWVFGAGMYGPQPPRPPAAPPPPATTAPAPAPTTQAPAPQPTKAPAPAPSPSSTRASRAPSTAPGAPPSATSPAARPGTASNTPAPPASPTEPTPDAAAPTATDAPSATVSAEPTASAAAPEAPPAPAASGQQGSPVGALATGGVVLAGAGALGGWWFLRRRGA